MPLKRRKFLLLSGFGFGLAACGKTIADRSSSATQPLLPVASPKTLLQKPLLRFVAVADTGTGDGHQYDVAITMSRYYTQNSYPLVILPGDNIYTNGEIERIGAVFERPYQSLLAQGVKFRACLGNHDVRTADGEPQVRYAGFNMQGRYYTFREKTVQFFALETNPRADWSTQVRWLERELSQSDAPWKIVFGHHPIYSSGRYGTSRDLVKTLTPLFKKYGVQLYINGHEHDYERTRPIDGTTYLVTGIGGARLRPVGRSEWTAFSTSRYGFTALAVYTDRIELEGIGTDGKAFDRGVIPLRSA